MLGKSLYDCYNRLFPSDFPSRNNVTNAKCRVWRKSFIDLYIEHNAKTKKELKKKLHNAHIRKGGCLVNTLSEHVKLLGVSLQVYINKRAVNIKESATRPSKADKKKTSLPGKLFSETLALKVEIPDSLEMKAVDKIQVDLISNTLGITRRCIIDESIARKRGEVVGVSADKSLLLYEYMLEGIARGSSVIIGTWGEDQVAFIYIHIHLGDILNPILYYNKLNNTMSHEMYPEVNDIYKTYGQRDWSVSLTLRTLGQTLWHMLFTKVDRKRDREGWQGTTCRLVLYSPVGCTTNSDRVVSSVNSKKSSRAVSSHPFLTCNGTALSTTISSSAILDVTLWNGHLHPLYYNTKVVNIKDHCKERSLGALCMGEDDIVAGSGWCIEFEQQEVYKVAIRAVTVCDTNNTVIYDAFLDLSWSFINKMFGTNYK